MSERGKSLQEIPRHVEPVRSTVLEEEMLFFSREGAGFWTEKVYCDPHHASLAEPS